MESSSSQQVPFISVVIPTYNRADFLSTAIDSVLKQTFTDFEVIVVDDGSTDTTQLMLRKYTNKIRYHYQSNAGVSNARNTGILIAKGEWVAFLDSDDEWKSDYLSQHFLHLQQFPQIIMQISNCSFISLDGKKESYFEINGAQPVIKNKEYVMLPIPFSFIVQHGPWQVGSTIFHKQSLIQAGLFDSKLNISEDYDLMARVALLGPLGLLNKELANIYRRKETTVSLSEKAKATPIKTREANETVYQKLLDIRTLKPNERKAICKLASSNRRAIGNILLEANKTSEAKICYKMAYSLYPSLTSAIKLALSYIPKELRMR